MSTNTNINTNVNTKVNKEETNMNTINVTRTAATKTIVSVIKKNNVNYLCLNGRECGYIGGSKKDIETNVKVIQYMVDNIMDDEHQDDLMWAARHFHDLMCLAANLDQINIEKIYKRPKAEYILDGLKLYKVGYPYGNPVLVFNIEEEYHVTNDIPKKDIEIIVNGWLNLHDPENETNEEEDNLLRFERTEKPTRCEIIQGMRNRALKVKWAEGGTYGRIPVAYTSKEDKDNFATLAQDSVDVGSNFVEVARIRAEVEKREGDPNKISEVEIEGEKTLYLEDKRVIMSTEGTILAELTEEEEGLSSETAKAILMTRAEEALSDEYENEYEDEYEDEEETLFLF